MEVDAAGDHAEESESEEEVGSDNEEESVPVSIGPMILN